MQERDARGVVPRRPGEVARGVSRQRGERLVGLAQHRDRDAAPPQAPHGAEGAVVGAEQQRARRRRPPRRHRTRASGADRRGRHRAASRRARDRPGDRAAAVPAARHEAHGRPEAPGRRRADEMQSGHRRLQPTAQHRVAIDPVELREQARVEEGVARHVDPVSRAQHHVVDLSRPTVLQPEPHAVSCLLDARHLAAHVELDVVETHPDEVRAGGPDRPVGDAILRAARQPSEHRRRGHEAAVPERPDVGRRVEHGPQRPEHVLRRVGLQPHDVGTADEDADLRAARLHERRALQRALPAADDPHAPARERAHVRVVAGVRHEPGRQRIETRRASDEGRDPGRHDDPPRGGRDAVVELQPEPARRPGPRAAPGASPRRAGRGAGTTGRTRRSPRAAPASRTGRPTRPCRRSG